MFNYITLYSLLYFLTFFFSRGGVVSASPNLQAGGPPLVFCPRLLIQFIRSYSPYRRPFLHPQPEDAPCYRDRDPPTLIKVYVSNQKIYNKTAYVPGPCQASGSHSDPPLSGRVICPSQGPDSTQQAQETEFHAPGGFGTSNPFNKRPINHFLDHAATTMGI